MVAIALDCVNIKTVALLSIKTSFKALLPPSPPIKRNLSNGLIWSFSRPLTPLLSTWSSQATGVGDEGPPLVLVHGMSLDQDHVGGQQRIPGHKDCCVCMERADLCVCRVFRTLTWPVGMLLNNKDKCRIKHLRTVVILMNREIWHHLALPLLLTASREGRTNNNSFAFNANRETMAQSSPLRWLHIWHLQHGDRAKNQDDQANQEDFGQRRPRQMGTTEMLNSEGVCFSPLEI